MEGRAQDDMDRRSMVSVTAAEQQNGFQCLLRHQLLESRSRASLDEPVGSIRLFRSDAADQIVDKSVAPKFTDPREQPARRMSRLVHPAEALSVILLNPPVTFSPLRMRSARSLAAAALSAAFWASASLRATVSETVAISRLWSATAAWCIS
jgi:hypothetical protein